jgi:RimJ/RimL family protein N-acetyltransferase
MELRDSEIVLRDWRLEDVDAVTAACGDPEIPRWIPWVPVPYTREHADAYVQQCLDAGEDRYPFAIAGGEGDKVLGSIDLRLNAHGYRGHVGYWVAAPARGRGVCTRALRLLSRWALEELHLQRMELITDPENVASQRVAEKVGYRREGVMRAHLRHPDGRIRDSVLFSLLPGEVLD